MFNYCKETAMKIKRVLKFYFYCDSLNKAINNLILRRALSSCGKSGEEVAEDILTVICEKQELGGLYAYLDGIMKKLPERDYNRLFRYAGMRTGIKSLPEAERNAVRSAAAKFVRRARSLLSYTRGLEVLGRYYPLISAE